MLNTDDVLKEDNFISKVKNMPLGKLNNKTISIDYE
jgi:hypothetical protein